MRIGINPTKLNNKIDISFNHRVIVPVYIPNLEGYFTDAIKILDHCFSSIYHTVDERTAITIIDNACCVEAKNYLEQQFSEGRIDQLIVNKMNLGKVDPLISAIRGCHEELITITDADVLFKSGWLQAVQEVFANFPKAGLVSPSPGPLGFQNYSTSILWDTKLSSSLKFRPLLDRKDMEMFLHSIGKPNMYNENHYATQLSVQQNGVNAIVGCGHFVITCRRSVFDLSPKSPSKLLIEGFSESDYIDKPSDVGGYWKLATVKNLAYHMGNTWEPWMDEYAPKTVSDRTAASFVLPPVETSSKMLPYRVKNKAVVSMFKVKWLRKFFFKKWGATFPIDQY